MRIVVSGTHASGKSTLISDFRFAHPGYTVLGDPFDELPDELDGASPVAFLGQLRASASRLGECGDADLIAERGPLDFLAYLIAWEELGRGRIDPVVLERATVLAAEAMRTVELIVLLSATGVFVPSDEDPELRDAMQEALFELCDDTDLRGSTRVEHLRGDQAERLRRFEALVA
ncbi:MAG: hypothetical protein J0H64_08945 [Actinobacteria bacterium]|nr:hypothetical protein [Actinomycetota bacterium]